MAAALAAAAINAAMGIGAAATKGTKATNKILRQLKSGGPLPRAKKAGGKRARKRSGRRTGSAISSAQNTKPSANSQRVYAPVTTGRVFRASRGRDHVISVPFNSISNAYVSSNGTGSALFTGPDLSTLKYYYDLGPNVNPVGGTQNYPFGVGVSNICKAYARYRVRRLRVTYVPIVPTTTAGSVILGATLENYDTGTPTLQNVADCENSITTPAWQECSMDLTGLLRTDPEWLYVYQSGGSAPEQRQQFCCTLASQGVGIQLASTNILGYLRFEGEIEFTSLSDVVGGFQANPHLLGNQTSEHESPLLVAKQEPTSRAMSPARSSSSTSAVSTRRWLG